MNRKPRKPDFFNQRFILWTNINLFSNQDYDKLKECCCVCQDTHIVDALSENYDALEALRKSMDIELEQPIISLDIHYSTDDEETSDYFVYPYCNLRYCFGFIDNGVKEWYVDEKGDLRLYEVNSDESCFSLYRMFKPSLTPRDVEHFKEQIIIGNVDWNMIERYTDSIGQIIFSILSDGESDDINEDCEDE